mmetsp:Transcript_32272/g.72815  ORF Transcript_32272/g.72815 Transcript_32272/m.72815 type:complete len:200 (+) Transcript_32272:680-1279(+)
MYVVGALLNHFPRADPATIPRGLTILHEQLLHRVVVHAVYVRLCDHRCPGWGHLRRYRARAADDGRPRVYRGWVHHHRTIATTVASFPTTGAVNRPRSARPLFGVNGRGARNGAGISPDGFGCDARRLWQPREHGRRCCACYSCWFLWWFLRLHRRRPLRRVHGVPRGGGHVCCTTDIIDSVALPLPRQSSSFAVGVNF